MPKNTLLYGAPSVAAPEDPKLPDLKVLNEAEHKQKWSGFFVISLNFIFDPAISYISYLFH